MGTGKSKTGTETGGGGWRGRRLRGLGSTVHHHSTAMGSDEEILVEGGNRNAGGKGNNQITVTHETVIEREEVSPTGSPTRNEHGHAVQESVSRDNGGAWDGGLKRG